MKAVALRVSLTRLVIALILSVIPFLSAAAESGLSKTRIYIIGKGSVGTYFSQQFSFVLPTTTIVRNIHQQRVKAPLSSDTVEWGDIDKFEKDSIILVCTKSTDLEEVGRLILQRTDGSQVIVLGQNGIRVADISAEIRKYPRLVRLVSFFGMDAYSSPDGEVKLAGDPLVGLCDVDVSNGRDLELVVDAFRMTKITPRVYSDLKSLEWDKAFVNLALSGLTTIHRLEIGQVLQNLDLSKLAYGILAEALNIARADGAKIDETAIASAYAGLSTRTTCTHRTSMLRDREAGRPTEAPYLYGPVVELAKRNGIAIPILSAVYTDLLAEPTPALKGAVRQRGCLGPLQALARFASEKTASP